MFSTMLVMVNSNGCGMTQAVAIAALKKKDDDHKQSTFEETIFDRRYSGFDQVRPIVDRPRDEVFRQRTPEGRLGYIRSLGTTACVARSQPPLRV